MRVVSSRRVSSSATTGIRLWCPFYRRHLGSMDFNYPWIILCRTTTATAWPECNCVVVVFHHHFTNAFRYILPHGSTVLVLLPRLWPHGIRTRVWQWTVFGNTPLPRIAPLWNYVDDFVDDLDDPEEEEDDYGIRPKRRIRLTNSTFGKSQCGIDTNT